MATRTITIVDDDFGDGDATETITWALDGTTYEVDLNDKNAKRLRDALAPFLDVSRRVGGKTQAAKKAVAAKGSKKKADDAEPDAAVNGANTTGHSNREIRDWARTTGLDVPTRGRIPAEIIAAFTEARDLADAS